MADCYQSAAATAAVLPFSLSRHCSASLAAQLDLSTHTTDTKTSQPLARQRKKQSPSLLSVGTGKAFSGSEMLSCLGVKPGRVEGGSRHSKQIGSPPPTAHPLPPLADSTAPHTVPVPSSDKLKQGGPVGDPNLLCLQQCPSAPRSLLRV